MIAAAPAAVIVFRLLYAPVDKMLILQARFQWIHLVCVIDVQLLTWIVRSLFIVAYIGNKNIMKVLA